MFRQIIRQVKLQSLGWCRAYCIISLIAVLLLLVAFQDLDLPGKDTLELSVCKTVPSWNAAVVCRAVLSTGIARMSVARIEKSDAEWRQQVSELE